MGIFILGNEQSVVDNWVLVKLSRGETGEVWEFWTIWKMTKHRTEALKDNLFQIDSLWGCYRSKRVDLVGEETGRRKNVISSIDVVDDIINRGFVVCCWENKLGVCGRDIYIVVNAVHGGVDIYKMGCKRVPFYS